MRAGGSQAPSFVLGRHETWASLTTKTTEREKVKGSALLVAYKPLCHDGRILYALVEVRAFPPFARNEAKDGAPTVVGG